MNEMYRNEGAHEVPKLDPTLRPAFNGLAEALQVGEVGRDARLFEQGMKNTAAGRRVLSAVASDPRCLDYVAGVLAPSVNPQASQQVDRYDVQNEVAQALETMQGYVERNWGGNC